MSGVTVRETLHHGDVRRVIVTTVPDLSPANVARVLARSPYVYDGMGAARVAAELIATGKGDHGWSRFEVVETDRGDCCPTCATARQLRDERDRLRAEFSEAFAALRAAGLEHDADHPIAARYREASSAVNHASRRWEGAARAS